MKKFLFTLILLPFLGGSRHPTGMDKQVPTPTTDPADTIPKLIAIRDSMRHKNDSVATIVRPRKFRLLVRDIRRVQACRPDTIYILTQRKGLIYRIFHKKDEPLP